MNINPAPETNDSGASASAASLPTSTDVSSDLQVPLPRFPNPNEVFCTEEGHYPDAALPSIQPSGHQIPTIGDAPYDIC